MMRPMTGITTSPEPEEFAKQVGRAPLAEGPGWVALSERDDLAKYKPGNSIGLFVAQLRLGIDDIDSFASDALTDDSNDKKCDIVAVHRDTEQLIIAQCYATEHPERKKEGPASKTSDLNTAVSWLLSGPLETLPDVLRDAAIEARQAIKDGEITSLEIWSVHNCPEGTNIARELDQAAKTANSLLVQYYPDNPLNVTTAEIGRDAVNELYRRTQLPILVTEEMSFETPGGYETKGQSWRAYNTAIKLSELRMLWQQHGTDLMSPNIRDYLGVRKTERNINFGIKTTAKHSPRDFIVYNNGITAMVHNYEVANHRVAIRGLGIVNGGQTTGSIGTLSDEDASGLDEAWVQIRFVESADATILENVVRFNNTQNKVEATDFRSGDAIQDRLRNEFSSVPEAMYRGGRRGGAQDAIRRDRALLSDTGVAQSVASFHGYPNLAYNELRQIWELDSTYARFFNDHLHARHIIFCYSLLKAVEHSKLALNDIPEEKRAETQRNHAEFFRSRGGVHLLTAAIGGSIETILGEVVPDRFAVRFKDNISPAIATEVWTPIVRSGLPFSGQLAGATNQGLKSQDRVKEAVKLFVAMIEATRESNRVTYDTFAAHVEQRAD